MQNEGKKINCCVHNFGQCILLYRTYIVSWCGAGETHEDEEDNNKQSLIIHKRVIHINAPAKE